jgi:uncharacterized damage-inducible protein DinB
MKDLLKQYASYNVWANQTIVTLLLSLPAETLHKEIQSSFRSLHLTLLHMYDVEQIWWQRMKLLERIQSIARQNISTEDAAAGLINQSKQWEEWVDKNTLAGLEHVFAYQNLKGEPFKQPLYQMLLHLFNHQTYHRGQIVTMLRQAGFETIPSTDFITWSRRNR